MEPGRKHLRVIQRWGTFAVKAHIILDCKQTLCLSTRKDPAEVIFTQGTMLERNDDTSFGFNVIPFILIS